MEKNYHDTDFFQENECVRTYFSLAERSVDVHTQSFWEFAYAYEGAGAFYGAGGLHGTEHSSNAEVSPSTMPSSSAKDSLSTKDSSGKKGSLSTMPSSSIKNGHANQELPFRIGSLLLIKPGTPHAITSQPKESGSPLRLVNCILTKKYMNALLEEYKNTPGIENFALYKILFNNQPFILRLTDDNAQNILHLIWLIAHEYNHFTIGSETIIRNSLLSLLVCITRLYDYQSGASLPMVSERFDIDELLKYISINYGSKLSLDLLAANMHLSREYLCRYFKKHTGKTIFDYIREVRIAQAKHLLLTSSHTIADIGIFCGYPSVSSFQRAFRAEEGISPGEFREKNSY